MLAAQLVLIAIVICAYGLVQPDPDSLSLGSTGPFAEVFKSAFPVPSDNAYARAMFKGLFVPLSYLYMLSMVIVAAMLSRDIGYLLREPKKNWALLAVIFVLFGGSWAFLFGPTEYAIATKSKRQILDGSVVGYLGFFCGGPFLCILVLLSLPSSKMQRSR